MATVGNRWNSYAGCNRKIVSRCVFLSVRAAMLHAKWSEELVGELVNQDLQELRPRIVLKSRRREKARLKPLSSKAVRTLTDPIGAREKWSVKCNHEIIKARNASNFQCKCCLQSLDKRDSTFRRGMETGCKHRRLMDLVQYWSWCQPSWSVSPYHQKVNFCVEYDLPVALDMTNIVFCVAANCS